MVPGLLLAAEMTVLRRMPRRSLGQNLLPLAAMTITAAAVWGGRALVLGGFAGEHPAAALASLSAPQRLLTMLQVVPEWLRLLLAPLHLQADYSPQEVALAQRLSARQIPGALLLVLAATAAVRARRAAPVLTFAACWLAITLFPVSNLVLPTGILLAERTLFLPSVGGVLAVGAGIRWLSERQTTGGTRLRATIVGVGAILLVAGASRSALRQRVWRDHPTFIAHLVNDAPRSYRARWMYAHSLVARDRAGAEREFRLALSLFSDDPTLLAEMAVRYRTIHSCDDAMRSYREALARDAGNRSSLRRRMVECLVVACRVGQRRYDPP